MSGAHRARRNRRVVRRVVGGVLFAAALLLGVGMVAAAVLGVRAVPVLTGSMTPYAPPGSLVLTVPVRGDEVQAGDVVAFRPPAPYVVTGGHPLLHRVHELGTADGQAYLTTKGDANADADPWRVSTTGGRFGRAVLVVPVLGRVVAGGTHAAVPLGLGVVALLGAATFRRPGAPCCSGHDGPGHRDLGASRLSPAAAYQRS